LVAAVRFVDGEHDVACLHVQVWVKQFQNILSMGLAVVQRTYSVPNCSAVRASAMVVFSMPNLLLKLLERVVGSWTGNVLVQF